MVIINCDIFANEIKKSGIEHFPIWKKVSFLSLRYGKIFRKLHLFKIANINPNLFDLKSDCIIIFDSGIEENSVLKWFANYYKDRRLIFYYWNPVFTSIHPDKIPSKFEKWSYSPSDCKKYGMKYNSQFYFKSLIKEPVQIQRDVFFIGKNKGRESNLRRIKDLFDKYGLTSLFFIIATHPRLNQKKYKKRIPYSSVLDYVNESRAILDYYVDPQAGLSLRAMESLFYGKKIITNNKTIEDYNFYNIDNVFILDNDDNGKINSFLYDTPPIQVNSEIKASYLFDSWLKRFF